MLFADSLIPPPTGAHGAGANGSIAGAAARSHQPDWIADSPVEGKRVG